MTQHIVPEVFKPLWKEKARYRGAYGGRGSGKSHNFATMLVIRAVSQKGFRAICVREVQRSLKESALRLVSDTIDRLNLGGEFSVQTNQIKTPGDGLISFTGMQDHTAESIKSLENIHVAWVEEASNLSARSLELLRPTIRAEGSEIWFSWNPRNETDAVDQFLRSENIPENAIVVKSNYDSNQFFPSELEEERLFDKKHNVERYSHIWDGEYEPRVKGAIWDRATIHAHRRSDPPEMNRIVVAVDPAVSEEGGDEHGIIVCGIGEDNRGYVLDDLSRHGSPKQWAEQTIAAYDKWSADAIVIEINQGGDMVRHTLESVRPGIRIIEVRATKGKHVRAEPISALYQLGRVSHVGTFDKLETQMCQVTSAGYQGDGSPDRVDAMVWAMTELFPKLNRQKPKEDHRENVSASWMG